MSGFTRDNGNKPGTKSEQLRKKNERINGGFYLFPNAVAESEAYRSLSGHAAKALHRIVLEHSYTMRKNNGGLVVTHRDLKDEWINPNRISEAIDELVFKGLIRVRKGKGHGVKFVNEFTVTFFPTSDGLAASNDYLKCGIERVEAWRKHSGDKRRKVWAKKKIAAHTGVNLSTHTGVNLLPKESSPKSENPTKTKKVKSHTGVTPINNMGGVIVEDGNSALIPISPDDLISDQKNERENEARKLQSSIPIERQLKIQERQEARRKQAQPLIDAAIRQAGKITRSRYRKAATNFIQKYADHDPALFEIAVRNWKSLHWEVALAIEIEQPENSVAIVRKANGLASPRKFKRLPDDARHVVEPLGRIVLASLH